MARTPEKDEEILGLLADWMAQHKGPERMGEFEKLVADGAGYNQAELWELITAPVAAYREKLKTNLDGEFPEPVRLPALVQHSHGPTLQPGRVSGVMKVMPGKTGNSHQRLEGLDMDVERLRAWSLKPDEDMPDGIGIKAPTFFAACIDKQIAAAKLSMQVGEELYDVERVRAYLKRVGEIVMSRVSTAAPEIQDEIIADMRQLEHEFSNFGPVNAGR